MYTKNMKNSTYHSLLRIASLTLAIVLVFDSGLLTPVTRQVSQDTQDYLASAIGMYASIQPTELNQLTADLTQREQVLTQRENDLAAREISVELDDSRGLPSAYSTYIMSILLFIILLLIMLNYLLDYIRARKYMIENTHEKVV